MTKFKYLFNVEKIVLRKENFRSKSYKEDFLANKEYMKKVQSLKGLPITIILDENEDYPNEGTFIAKNRAEDKASEAVAIFFGVTFGGTQKHLKNYIKDAEIRGRFVVCKLISIEQIE